MRTIDATVRCACPSLDSAECWLRRYPVSCFDAQGFPAILPTPSDIETDGGPCTCACHAAWDSLFADDAGDDDDE